MKREAFTTIAGILVAGVFASMLIRERSLIQPADVHQLVKESSDESRLLIEDLRGELVASQEENEFWQLMSRILATSGWAIVIADRETHQITHWEGASEGLFLYSKEEALTMTVEDLMIPEIREGHKNHLSGALPGHAHVIDCKDALNSEGQVFEAKLMVSVSPDRKHILALFRSNDY